MPLSRRETIYKKSSTVGAATATNITASANNSTDETVYLTFLDGATGTQGLETDTGFTYNPSTGVLTTTSVTGNLTGNVTGNTSGTAATVTGGTQASITAAANLVTVGALNSGSITSGFTSIDVGSGAITTTGAISGATIDATTDFTIGTTVITDDVITFTPTASDTITMTAATNGAFSLVTVDNAAAAANIQITADGTVDIDSAGVLTLDSGAAINIEPAAGSAILLDGTISVDAGVITGATSITSSAFVGALTGNVTGNTSGTAATVTTAAQTNITSLGTLTALTVDDVVIDGKVVTMTGSSSDTAVFTVGTNGTLSIVTTDAAAAAANLQITADGTVDIDSAGVLTLDSGAAINIEPAAGSAILLDGTISVDAGVVTGATSITSTAFVGDITGDVTGDASGTAAIATSITAVANNSTDETVYLTFVDGATGTQGIETDTGLSYNPSTGLLTATTFSGSIATATESTNVTVVANNSTDETVYPAFVDGATGTQGIETDTGLTYNPSSGVLTTTSVTGNLTGNVTGNTSGTAATVTTAAQTAITSLGTLTTLTVDSVIINGTNIGHTSDTDSMAIASDGVVTFSQIPVLPANSIDSDHYVDGSIDNAHIADDAIDSEHYAAGSIDTAHIADNQITLAKMAGGTDGNVISYDASGDPVAIATGSDGQVLTSTGAGSPPAFEDLPGSSGVAADDISIGDAAVLLTTSSGNITIDAAANDSDIILKGTDGTSDTTFLTIDGSAAGLATFNAGATLGGNLIIPDDGNIGSASDTNAIAISSAGVVTMDQIPVFSAGINVSGGTIAGTLATAAQGNITSLGTLTALTVDDVAIDGKVITMTGSSSDTAVLTVATNGALSLVTTDAAAAAANIQITADGTVDIDSAGVLTLDSGAAINIEPAAGSAILLDGTISVDAGVVTGATSITSTAFVGALTGNVTGNASGTAATVTTAAQTNITSLGTLTALTVDDVAINGKVVTMTGSSSDTAVFTAGTNGTLSIVTTDAAAAAANIQITADGTVDIDSAGVLTLDSGAAINIEPASGSAILLDGTISVDAGVVTGATSITSTAFVGDITGDVTGNASGTAATVTTAAQTNITSLGTLTALTVDDVAIDGKVITMTGSSSDTAVITAGTNGTLSIVTTDAAAAAANIQITADGTVDIDSAGVLTLDSGAAINIEPASGSAILLDGTISIDAGVVTGATSITSTAFVGDITGDVTGTADTATVATTVTITDNESTNEDNAIIFTAGGDVDGGNIGLESDGTLIYNPSTGTVTATIFKGNIDAVDGDFDGTLEADALTVGGTNVLTGSLITTLGTISAGVWQGTAVASGYIAADAITGAKIADNAIDSEHYTDGSIDNAHIADDAIDSEHYADGSIDNAHIADDAIDSEHYADGSIDTAHIGDLQVTTAKLAADSVTAAKIGDNVIDSEHYAAASIDNEHLADDAVDSDELAAGAVDAAHLASSAVTTAKIAADAVTGAKIADDAIDSEHYTDGSIDNAHIADDAIDSEHYADGSIDNAHIADDAIDSEHYAAGSIDTAHIADNQITLAKMAGGTDGNIISYDASGDPVAIATGSDGQVLTSAGAGAPPAFEDAGGGGPDQANQAAIEAETNEDTYIPPDLLKHGPGVAKVFCNFEQEGTHSIFESYNVASVIDGGASGDTDILWATDFSNDTYSLVGTSEGAYYTMRNIYYQPDTKVAGGVTIICVSTNPTIDSGDICVVGFGDQ